MAESTGSESVTLVFKTPIRWIEWLDVEGAERELPQPDHIVESERA